MKNKPGEKIKMSADKVELFVHPLCPFAQRALYTAAYKSVPAEITHVSVANPEDWFLVINPRDEVPAVRVTRNGQIFHLTESLNIAEYFDSFPGPALYPRLENGKVDPVLKGVIDVFIKLKVGRFVSAFYSIPFGSGTEEEIKELNESLREINGFLENGNNVMHKVLGRNDFTLADLMILPYVERFREYWEGFDEKYKSEDVTNLWNWYERVSAEPWALEHKVPVHRLRSLSRIVRAGNYKGLDLPLSIYD